MQSPFDGLWLGLGNPYKPDLAEARRPRKGLKLRKLRGFLLILDRALYRKKQSAFADLGRPYNHCHNSGKGDISWIF